MPQARNYYCYQTKEKPPPQVIKIIMFNLDYKVVFMSLCIMQFFTVCEGRPLRKRTVSEVQLMHNLGEHKQLQERQEWLQMWLWDIHTAPSREGRARRRLSPEELPDLSDLTPEEIQHALDLLEKLLKSKQS
ncbi:hypothetical protein L3Q82_024257 [Scortum barcoo]|uniref:Uncharacterized protein n=1 Tax=Scortum barcoo TaxID=214431 RepID=A0ACB8WWN0_9TELE|nr:hypothetical protein L3Q82_024257 [Scortum barcoo]